jgi:DNA-binding GntR family transcriptional regulator
MAACCAARADAATRREVSEAAARSLEEAKGGDQAGFRSSDIGFHAAIASATSNPRITGAVEAARALIATLRERDFPTRRRP